MHKAPHILITLLISCWGLAVHAQDSLSVEILNIVFDQSTKLFEARVQSDIPESILLDDPTTISIHLETTDGEIFRCPIANIEASMESDTPGDYAISFTLLKENFYPEEQPLFFVLDIKNNIYDLSAKYPFSFRSITRYIPAELSFEILLSIIVIGIIIIGLLLLIFVYSVPIINNRRFVKQYVKKYREVKRPGRLPKDPLTLEGYKDDDDVVVLGDKMMKLASWMYYKEIGGEDQTGIYSELFQLQTRPGKFFVSKAYGKLSWIWLGALGGFLATLTGILLNKFAWQWLTPIIESIAFYFNQHLFIPLVLADTINGFALGLVLTFCLNIMQARRSTRRIRLSPIVLNALLGGLVGMIVFFIGTLILSTTSFMPSFLAYLIIWILIGAIIGAFNGVFLNNHIGIDLKSGILLGLKGGLGGGLIAFLIGYGTSILVSPDFGQMLGFMSYGGILGLFLYTTLQPLTDFRLVCLSPSHFSGWSPPISKWLKGSSIDEIVIGKKPGSYVYIKWDDEGLMPIHAVLKYANQKVYIEPRDGEVLVNNMLIHRAHVLDDKDIIRLGIESISVLQFRTTDSRSNNDSSSNNQEEQFFPVMTPILKRSEWRKRIDID